MERGIRFALVLSALLLTSVGVKAEGDDFGIWTEANVEKKVSRNLSIDAGVEMRTRDHVKTVDRWSEALVPPIN
jgi:hypothetical protein